MFYLNIIFSEQLILWLAGNSNGRLSSSTSTGRSYLRIVKIIYIQRYISIQLFDSLYGWLPSFNSTVDVDCETLLREAGKFQVFSRRNSKDQSSFLCKFLVIFYIKLSQSKYKNKMKSKYVTK